MIDLANPQLSAQLGRAVNDALALGTSVLSNAVTAGTNIATGMARAAQPGAGTVPGFGKALCCPPQEVCPPRCLAEIRRSARPGEVILVPFRLRNPGDQVRQYQIGVHPLLDQDGNPAPTQPTLSTVAVQVPPRSARLVEMRLVLAGGYAQGQVYQADVVVREKKFNQSICFTLTIDGEVPEITPLDEEDLSLHFVPWQYHYFCEEPMDRRQPAAVARPDVDVARARPAGSDDE